MNIQDLKEYLAVGDPIADPVTELLTRSLKDHWPKDGNLFRKIKLMAGPAHPEFQEFVDQTQRVPDWVRFSDFDQGQELFLRTSPVAIGVMVLGVLGRTYAPGYSADVLVATGRLKGGIVRRLYETADMVHKLLQPDGLRPGNSGHEAVVRVRLMHSLVRQRLIQGNKWHYKGQAPISQLETALVGTEFVYCLITGLEKLGFAVTAKERQSYVALWRYANYLQGVDEKLLPSCWEEVEICYQAFRKLVWSPNKNSELLMRNLLDGLHWLPPFYLPKGVLESIACLLMEPDLCNQLKIRSRLSHRVIIGTLSSINKLIGKHNLWFPSLSHKEAEWGRHYFDQVLDKGLGGKPANYLA